MKKYKKSVFNYVYNSSKGHLIYNTLYNSLSRLSDEEYGVYLSEDESGKLTGELVAQGLWVDRNIDESEQYYLYTYYANKYINEKPHITVTPTMECNARCFYCYEEGVRCGKMKKEYCDGIIAFLKKMDCSQGIDITWFGGEPLMNQEWMDCFSDSLEDNGIDFSAFIITNGSRIDDAVIEKMAGKWRIRDVQITIDGSADEYAARKAYVDQDETVYYKILKTISKLSKKGIGVQIRLNIDRNNRDSIARAVEDITELFRDNPKINYYPAFLTGIGEALTETEKVDFIKKLIELSQNRINANEILYRLPRTSACYYNQKGAYSLDTKGNVYICEHLLGHEEEAIGNINDDILFPRREQSGKRAECRKCVFLPKCQGGCNDTYKQGEIPCFIDKYMIKAYLALL